MPKVSPDSNPVAFYIEERPKGTNIGNDRATVEPPPSVPNGTWQGKADNIAKACGQMGVEGVCIVFASVLKSE